MQINVPQMAESVVRGERRGVAKAITLLESTRPDHRVLADELLTALLPHTGKAFRLGLSGVPGVGKSTFIESLGLYLIGQGLKVAVLAIDPSSSLSGGSILGDKTRMERLSADPNAFIRPSPAGRSLGGVARATRESILLCEAAGFDVVLVETVGVGQSETTVSEMVDIFVVLMLAGAGDELQGIKRGVLEIADLITVNKADGDNVKRARMAAADYRRAIHLMTPASPNWTPPVMTCSALTNEGLPQIWDTIVEHRERLTATGERATRRQRQQIGWMWSLIGDGLLDEFRESATMATMLPDIEAAVLAGELPPAVAADRLLAAFLR